MAIRTVIEMSGLEFELTLAHDEGGRYVAEAVGLPGAGPAAGRRLRVVAPFKEKALRGLLAELRALAEGAEGGQDRPPAA